MIDQKKILSSSQLPTLPSVAMKLLELARDPETEFKDVIDVVKSDPAITTKILKAANSSFFGFKSPVTSIERAVPLLGTTVVTTLALSFSLVDAAMASGPLAQHYTAYWKQSIVQAVAAEVLAEHYAKTLSSDCFLTGLLLDLGRLAILKNVVAGVSSGARRLGVARRLAAGTRAHPSGSRPRRHRHRVDAAMEAAGKAD